MDIISKPVKNHISPRSKTLSKDEDISTLSPEDMTKISGGTAPAIIVAVGPIVASGVAQ